MKPKSYSMTRKFTLTIFTLIYTFQIYGQSTNVNCATAFTIPDPIEWCSEGTEFNNTNAGGSEYTATDCFAAVQHDLWFEFIAFAKAVNIVVNAEQGGSLNNPRVVLYSGSCGEALNIIRCEANNAGPDIANLFQNGLTLGEKYLIRVGGSSDNQGSFQLCINNYNPPVDPGQDFETASILCDKSSFVVQVLGGSGNDGDEASGTCLDVGGGDSENQSTWFTWIAGNDGLLSFSIDPINPSDDLDFVLFELPNGIDDPTGKFSIRCMASGCQNEGATGLNESSTDLEEMAGCPAGNDGFVKALTQETGKAYGLLINNFSNSNAGFAMEFSGDAEFVGPEPDFSITIDPDSNPEDGLTCDKLFEVNFESGGGLGTITDYEWNFGEGAIPQTGSGPGPHQVNFESFGEKYVVLTVTSDLGCIVTAVEQLYAAPCCVEVEAIEVEPILVRGYGCPGDETGLIQVRGEGGFPEYQYSFEGGPFSSLSTFSDLEVGEYTIGIVDIKGCTTERTFEIEVASPVSIDAGEDSSVEFLGDETQLNGTYSSLTDVTLSWSPENSVYCSDGTTNCTDPIVKPPGTTTFIFSLIDEFGCIISDNVTIEVENTRPIFAPNVFSPNDDGVNDFFAVVGNPISVLNIQELIVFDRWGNKVFFATNLDPTDSFSGWNGKIDGMPAKAGVYSWMARVIYLDNQGDQGVYEKGEVTLIR